MTSAICHIISSSSDSDNEGFAPKSKYPITLSSETTALARKVYRHDFSCSDSEEEILPLRERLKRAANAKNSSLARTACHTQKVSCEAPIAISSDDDDDVTVVEAPNLERAREKLKTSPPRDMNTSLPDLDVDEAFMNDPLVSFNAKHIKEINGFDGDEDKAETKVRKKTDAPNVRKKTEALRQREAKKRERDEVKAVKLLVAEQRKEQKPGECLKLVKAIVDARLLAMADVAVDIPRILQESNVNYVVSEQIVPKSVTWKRNVVERSLSNTLQVDKTVAEVDEDEVIVVLSSRELVEAVHHFKQGQIGAQSGRTLRDLVRNYKSLLPEKKITVLIIGIQKYYREQSRKERQIYKAQVRGIAGGTKKSRHGSEFAVTRVDIEEAAVELQIQESCNLRFAEKSIEVAQMIASFSKAVAEAPYKRERENGLMFSWLSGFDVRKSIKVDKDGNGLLLLWQRQIQQFNNVSGDMAQAIIAEYPSPLALLKTYEQCCDKQECEMLLKDINVRRGAGPLATTRKIGRELSRRIHKFMTSNDGSVILD